MSHLKIKSQLEKLIDCKVTRLELNSDLIKKKGIYELDNGAYFLLYPNYLSESSKLELLNATENFEFSQSNHNSRETYHIGPEYSYGKMTHKPNDKWDVSLLKQKALLEIDLLTPFNSVLVNRYSKDQFIPFHKDNESCLPESPTIASLSLGDSGKMTVKNDSGSYIDIQLYPGTLLVMGGSFNEQYYHQVIRDTNKKKYRLNFTFRYICHEKSTKTTAPSSINPRDPVLKELSVLKSKIISMESRQHNQSQKSTVSEKNNKVVLFRPQPSERKERANQDEEMYDPPKLPESINSNSIVELLNSDLSSENQLSIDDIKEVEDHRNKNGPIVITFSEFKTKITILKLFKMSKSYSIRDHLSKTNTLLRKRAISLRQKKLIERVWVYRGSIYYSLPCSPDDGIMANSYNLRCMEQSVPRLATGR